MEDEFIEMDEYDSNTKEKNVYSKEARNELVENDEISAEEEGFMAGYEAEEEEDDEEEKI